MIHFMVFKRSENRTPLFNGDQEDMLILLSMGTLAGPSPTYSRTCVKRILKNRQNKILMTNGSLMKVESIAECSPWSILHYF